MKAISMCFLKIYGIVGSKIKKKYYSMKMFSEPIY